MSIGTFQKQPFGPPRFVLLACVYGESQAVSKTKFAQLDVFHSSTDNEGLMIELVFNGFELLVDQNFSEVTMLFWHKKFVLLACMLGESWAVSKMSFIQLNMFHGQTETEGLITELAFSMVLNYMSIGTFQKQPFWRQKIVLLWGVIGSFENEICEICTFRHAPQLN